MKVRMNIHIPHTNNEEGYLRILFNEDYYDRYYVYKDAISACGKNEGNKNLHRRFEKSRIK